MTQSGHPGTKTGDHPVGG